jgi:hypothetical protein
LSLGAIGLIVSCVAGCRGLAPPSIFHPGTAPQQQARAERFDPYPENEPGPTIQGSRPPGYDKPIPEVDRARWPSPPSAWLPWNWGTTR